MTIKEFRSSIEALEAAHAETCDSSNNPHDTARRFIRAVGADTAAQCVAAMVRRLHWDGRISRQSRQWAEGVALSEEWERRIDDAYTSIHAAHLSQIAEAIPAELEHAQAEEQPAADRYLEQVEQADSLNELDTITEAAANDDALTSAEYETIYAAALRKAQGWDPQNHQEGTTDEAENIQVGEVVTLTFSAEDARLILRAVKARANYWGSLDQVNRISNASNIRRMYKETAEALGAQMAAQGVKP